MARTASRSARRSRNLIALLSAAFGLYTTSASATLTYTYTYDFSQLQSGVAGQLSFTTPSFITDTTFFPAIYHSDPPGDPFQRINFRNPFDLSTDGSPLSTNPVLDLILQNFSIGGFIGGPINQFGTITQLDLGPNDHSTLTIAPAPTLSIPLFSYTYDYDFSALDPGVTGNFSFIVPTFITTTSTFTPFPHTDPNNDPLEFFGIRNAFEGYDGSVIQTPVIDLVLDGFSIGGLIPGPLDHVGTFVQLDLGEHDLAVLTISGTPDPVPEPGSASILGSAVLFLIGLRWRRSARPLAG